MQSSRLVGTFLGPDNAIGLGLTDWMELILLVLLVPALQFRPRFLRLIHSVSRKTMLCSLITAILPLLLRVALLPNHPAPTPRTSEEFSHLLVADTLRHLRFANPPHPLPQFFETPLVLQQPSYSSSEPLGQGLLLAFGQALFGIPWAGVVLSTAVFCALCYWMLLGWTTSIWALIGALLAVMEFGPLNEWMNTYSGGALPAIAGCLVFGALPRLHARARFRDAALLGAGLSLQLLAQPCQFVLLVLSIACFFVFSIWSDRAISKRTMTCAIVALLAVLPAIALTTLQNERVTGHWYTLPYSLSQQQYGVPAALTVQPNPAPSLPLTREQALDYKQQRSFHGEGPDTLAKFFLRLEYRVRFYRFFLIAPLYLAMVAFLISIRQWRSVWIILTLALFALGSNLIPYFYPTYIAAATCLFVLASVLGLQQLAKLSIHSAPVGQYAASTILLISALSFCTFYGAHLFEHHQLSAEIERYETWDAIAHGALGRQSWITNDLQRSPGKQLVFVSYRPNHPFQDEWIYNAADIDGAQIVWARDLGQAENEKLLRYYPDRTVWLLDPDARPPLLSRYQAASTQFLDVR